MNIIILMTDVGVNQFYPIQLSLDPVQADPSPIER